MHSFKQSLAWSESYANADWWEDVYKEAFEDYAHMIYIAKDGWRQRSGVDRLVFTEGGRTIKIDEKVRSKEYNDIFIEYISSKEHGTPGWAEKDLDCDFIAYAFAKSGVCYLLPFLQLRKAWKQNKAQWLERYGSRNVPNKGYTTVGCPVNTKVLYTAITGAMRVKFGGGF